MALKYATKTGNWSDTTVWNGGTLPGAADDVHANGYTVTIDQDVTVLSLRTTASSPAVAGGGFTVATNRSVNADIYPGTSNCLTLGANSITCSTAGTIYGSASNNIHGIRIASAGVTLSHTGNVNGPTLAGSTAGGIFAEANNATINVTGNLIANRYAAIYANYSGARITVLGDCTTNYASSALFVTGGGTGSFVDVTGGGTSATVNAPAISSNAVDLTVRGGAWTAPINFGGTGTFVFTPTNPAAQVAGFICGGAGANITLNCDIRATSVMGLILSGVNSVCTINGSVSASSTTNGAYGVRVDRATTLTVNGNVTGGSAGSDTRGIGSGSPMTLTVNGNVTAGSAGPGVRCDGALTCSVTGNVTASAAHNGIYAYGSFSSGSVVGGLNAGIAANVYHAVATGSNALSWTFSGGNFGMRPVSWVGGSSGVCTITPNNTASGMFGIDIGGVAGSVANITGNLYAQSGVNGLNATSLGTINLIGNVFGATSGAAAHGVSLSASSPGTVNLTGNVTGGSATSSRGVTISGTGTVNITGDVTARTGNDAQGVRLDAMGAVNVYGTATATNEVGGTYNHAVHISVVSGGGCFVQVVKSNNYPNDGLVSAAYAVNAYLTNPVVIDAAECGSGGLWPVSGRAFVRDAGTNFVKMRQSNAGAVTVIGEVANDYPLPAHVRSGVAYDFGAKTGTCAVPPAGSVALGVPVDATTGTAALSPADLWSHPDRTLTDKTGFALTSAYDAAKTSASSAELAAAVSFILANVPEGLTAAEVWAYATRSLTVDVGLSPALTARLEQCATVQSTGDQLAAMGV